MAKVTNPLHSLSASGALGKTIIFTNSPNGARAIAFRAPKGTSTPAKTAYYAAGCAAWQLLDSNTRTAWKVTASKKKLTGFNAFMSDWLLGIIPPLGTIWDGGATTWDGGSTTFD